MNETKIYIEVRRRRRYDHARLAADVPLPGGKTLKLRTQGTRVSDGQDCRKRLQRTNDWLLLRWQLLRWQEQIPSLHDVKRPAFARLPIREGS